MPDWQNGIALLLIVKRQMHCISDKVEESNDKHNDNDDEQTVNFRWSWNRIEPILFLLLIIAFYSIVNVFVLLSSIWSHVKEGKLKVFVGWLRFSKSMNSLWQWYYYFSFFFCGPSMKYDIHNSIFVWIIFYFPSASRNWD